MIVVLHEHTGLINLITLTIFQVLHQKGGQTHKIVSLYYMMITLPEERVDDYNSYLVIGKEVKKITMVVKVHVTRPQRVVVVIYVIGCL